jgi:hypothetical protein
MAITQTTSNAVEATKLFTASHFDDAGSPAAASFTPGFRPRYVRVDNVTDRIKLEWYEGMNAAHAVKTAAAGTVTLETSAVTTVTVTEGAQPSIAFPVTQNKQYRIQAMA